MVDDLSIVDSIIFHIRTNVLPCLVSSDHLNLSVLIYKTNLCDQFKFISEIIALVIQSELTFEPAISQRYAKLVLLFHIFCDVKSKVLLFIMIIAVIWCKNFIADLFSI